MSIFNSKRKVFFKDIIPTAQQVNDELRDYRSDIINLKGFDGKLYVDPIYSKELP